MTSEKLTSTPPEKPSLKLPAELEPHLGLNPVFQSMIRVGRLPTVEEYILANWLDTPPEEFDEYEQEFIDLLRKHQPPAPAATTGKEAGP